MHFGTKRELSDGYGIDVLWPPDGQCDRDSNVDIVFVHGLGGKRHSTWMKGGVLWPLDLLAKDFPRARIMTWGYDSKVMKLFGPVGQGSIHTHANELNNDLSQERSERYQVFRPLIFFAHSLGGLVVKNALLNSWLEYKSDSANKDRSMAIERSTVAVIFAGTPHQGSDKAKWASIATKLAAVIQKDHSSKLSDALKRGSDTLQTLHDWFKKIENNFHVFTFVEEVPVHKVGSIVEIDSAAIHCGHEKKRMIHANHMEMVRFDDKNCNEYKKVKDAFRQIHQHDIDGRTRDDVWQPPRRLETSRNGFQRTIEGPVPNRLSNSRLLENHQSPVNLGRANTVGVEQPFEHSRIHSNDRHQNGGFLRHWSHPLTHRASTTTLGTMDSGFSRRSVHSDRLDETGRSNETRGSVLPYDSHHFANVMAEGRRLARRRNENFLTNLRNAKMTFQEAYNLLRPQSQNYNGDLASVQYHMMNIEFEMAFHRDKTPQQKLSHLQIAEQHGWDAAANARKSNSDQSEAEAECAGLLPQIQLYMAVIKGRRAEIHERLQVSQEAARRQKDEALSEIACAIRTIREVGPSNVQESEDFARTWTERLKPLPTPLTLHQCNHPHEVDTSRSVQELGTSRSFGTPLPTYSDLSIATNGIGPPPYTEMG